MTWNWMALAALGAGHGLNPGMGWLFAVALGLQEGRARAVWRALPPLALGHAMAVGAAVLGAAALGRLVPTEVLARIVGVVLVALGARRLVRHRHPRYGGMRVNFRELTTWSFLMATAHGAGLMVLPLLLRQPSLGAGTHHDLHIVHVAAASMLPVTSTAGFRAMLLHTGGYLLVTGLIAIVVYRKLGLRMLQTVWINLDLIWGVALIVTGGVALIA